MTRLNVVAEEVYIPNQFDIINRFSCYCPSPKASLPESSDALITEVPGL